MSELMNALNRAENCLRRKSEEYCEECPEWDDLLEALRAAVEAIKRIETIHAEAYGGEPEETHPLDIAASALAEIERLLGVSK